MNDGRVGDDGSRAISDDGRVVRPADASGGIMLGSAAEPGADDDWSPRPGTFGAYVVTDEPDALFARATAAGATVVREVYDTDYGSRDFAVRDPEGNLWSFGTYRGAPRTPRG